MIIQLLTPSDPLARQIEQSLVDHGMPGPIERIGYLPFLHDHDSSSPGVLILHLAAFRSTEGAANFIQSLGPGTKVIVLLDDFDADTVLDLMDSGVFRCLPIDRLSRLTGIVREVLGQPTPASSQVADHVDPHGAAQSISPELFLEVFEGQSEMVCRLKPNGCIIWVNASCCRYLGYQLEQLIGKPFARFLPEEDQANLMQALENVTPAQPVITLRQRGINRSGELRWHEWTNRAIFGAAREVVEYQVVGRDISRLVEIENELKRVKSLYSALVDGFPGHVAIIDPEGRVVFINSSMEKVFGKPAEEIVGKYAWEGYDDGQGFPDQAKKTVETVTHNQSPTPLELRVTRPDGSIAVALWWSSPVLNPEGQVEYMVGIGIDITEQKQNAEELKHLNLELETRVRERTIQLENATRALMENQERLNRLLTVNPVIIYAASPKPPYTLQFVSENIPQVTGYSLMEFLSKPGFFLDQIHIEDLARVMREYKEGIQAGHFICEYRFRRKTGEYIWVQDEINVNSDQEGEPLQLVGAFYDISERKKTEEALRLSQERYRLLAEAAQDYIYILSKDGVFEYVNGAGCRAIELPLERIAGRHHDEVLAGFASNGLQEFINKVIEQGEAIYQEHRIPLPGGTIWAGTWMVPLPEEGGEYRSVLAISRDITESRHSGEELQRALAREKELSDLKTRFVSMTSHEFRTPLSTILSSAELLEHYGYKWSEQKKLDHLRKIQGAVKHLSTLLEEVLVIGKADAGKLKLNLEEIDLVEFCASVVEEAQLGEGRFHPITFAGNVETLRTVTDPALIRQTLYNLLSNALKYSSKGSPVIVSLVAGEEDTTIEVSDQGMGIPVEEQAQLYEPFFRGKNALHIPGTGLGLAIVQRSLDLLGGSISAETQQGLGTVFRVVLPRLVPEVDPQPADKSDPLQNEVPRAEDPGH